MRKDSPYGEEGRTFEIEGKLYTKRRRYIRRKGKRKCGRWG